MVNLMQNEHNLTQKQYEKIEKARKEKEKLLDILKSKKDYVKVSPIISFTTVKQYPDGTQKYFFKTDIPKEVKEKEEIYADVNKQLTDKDKDITAVELVNEKAKKLSTAYQSANRARMLAFDIAYSNTWDFFVTLTFNKNKVNRLDDNAVRNKFANWLHTLHKKFPDCKYMFFPEYHKNGGLHFHGLLANVSSKDLQLKESGLLSCHWAQKKYCSVSYYNKTKKYHTERGVDGTPVYNMLSFSSGNSTVTLVGGSEQAIKYSMKYVTKTAVDERFFNKRRFWASHNVIRPYIEKIQLEVGSAYALRGSTDKHFIIEKNMLDMMCVDTSKWIIEYANDDIQYLILKRKIDIIDESGTVTTICKTQL